MVGELIAPHLVVSLLSTNVFISDLDLSHHTAHFQLLVLIGPKNPDY